jgi:hypothetical protein
MARSSRTSIIPDAGYVPGDSAAYRRSTVCARRSLQISVKQELTVFLPAIPIRRTGSTKPLVPATCPIKR